MRVFETQSGTAAHIDRGVWGTGSAAPQLNLPGQNTDKVRMKVLVIDDDDDVREITCITLTDVGGMDVIEADNSDEGVKQAELHQPDVILLDVRMPVKDGVVAMKLLRENAGTSKIPIIFLTAKALKREVAEFERMNVAGVILKPFNPLVLPAMIESIVRSKTGRSS